MNLLLVDDEPKNLFALSALLEDLGAELHCAQSGEEALRQVLKHDFAAILLDVRMPGIDGFETAAAIRSVERFRRTPIIFLSAHGDRRAEHRDPLSAERRDPLVEFMLKPVDPNVIRPRLAAHLGRSAPARRPAY
jgi:CheY-like chemotaxis protein